MTTIFLSDPRKIVARAMKLQGMTRGTVAHYDGRDEEYWSDGKKLVRVEYTDGGYHAQLMEEN